MTVNSLGLADRHFARLDPTSLIAEVTAIGLLKINQLGNDELDRLGWFCPLVQMIYYFDIISSCWCARSNSDHDGVKALVDAWDSVNHQLNVA